MHNNYTIIAYTKSILKDKKHKNIFSYKNVRTGKILPPKTVYF